jgi:hypothetical protein
MTFADVHAIDRHTCPHPVRREDHVAPTARTIPVIRFARTVHLNRSRHRRWRSQSDCPVPHLRAPNCPLTVHNHWSKRMLRFWLSRQYPRALPRCPLPFRQRAGLPIIPTGNIVHHRPFNQRLGNKKGLHRSQSPSLTKRSDNLVEIRENLRPVFQRKSPCRIPSRTDPQIKRSQRRCAQNNGDCQSAHSLQNTAR